MTADRRGEAAQQPLSRDVRPLLRSVGAVRQGLSEYWMVTDAKMADLVARVRAQVAEEIAQRLEKLAAPVAPSAAQYRQSMKQAAAVARYCATPPAEPSGEATTPPPATPEPQCPRCRAHGVPLRVAVCGPACHEAHTYVAPCEQTPADPVLPVPPGEQ